MEYPAAAWERAMRLQEVMLKAISGELHWFRAADILGMSPRGLRRWRERYERFGYDGLLIAAAASRRFAGCRWPRSRRSCSSFVSGTPGFNVRHFHEIARREHGVQLSYSYVKQALQTAGLVRRAAPAGGTGVDGSHGRASGSCCISTAACIPGSR